MSSHHADNVGTVDGDRLWQRLMEMARIGATAEGGVNRQAFSKEDIEARKLLIAWAGLRGFQVSTDRIGNLFVRREGTDPNAPAVLAGSHLDSQPSGGKFDGVYGVLAAFEALEALEDAGITTRHPIEAVAWSNEEGSRFQPGAMGSMIFSGSCQMEDLANVVDRSGIHLMEALNATRRKTATVRERGNVAAPRAYIEAHIEQGPLLEASGAQIGVVTGIQGSRWFNVEVRGASAHAGTTPRSSRADALIEAVAAISAMHDRFTDAEDVLRFTVGRLDVEPNSPNTVPDSVTFSVDLRHPDSEVLDGAAAAVEEICHAAMQKCSASVRETFGRPPCQFPTNIVDLVERSTAMLGYKHLRLPSGAFHDALFLSDICPTGMIFVPCENGISHNPRENARPQDLAAGANVLAIMLIELSKH